MEKKRPFWRNAFSQIVLKPRGILKMSQLWLPLSLVMAAGTAVDRQRRFPVSLYLLCAVLSKGLSSILINDLTDREIDRGAGKERWITALPSPAGMLVPVFLLGSGVLALIAAGGGPLVLGAYGTTLTLGILYSLKPVRFKERGVWGIIIYPLSAGILHTVVPWTLFRPAFWLLPLLFAAVAGDKLVQILFHQVVDFDSDRASEIKTFAVISGRRRAALTLSGALNFALAADAALLIGLLFQAWVQPLVRLLAGLVCLSAIGAAGLYVQIISKKWRTSTELTDRLGWPYLGFSYALFYLLPPLLFFGLALRERRLGVLAGLSVLSLIGVSVNAFSYDPKR